MRIQLLTLVLFAIHFFSSAQVSNVLPMYGPGKKTKEQIKLDQKFMQDVTKQFGSRQKACEAHIDFAWRYFYNNDLETAMKRFNQAWLLNPEYPDCYFGFAALTILSDQDQALKYIEKGERFDMDKNRAPECFQRASKCLEQLNHFHHSVYFYGKLIELEPNSAFYYKKRGYLLASINRFDEAMKDYGTAIKLDPNDALTFNNRGFRYQQDGNLELAIDDYTKALSIDSNYISARLNRALSYIESNKLNEALKDLNRCIELDKSHGPFYSLKGQLLFELDELDQACNCFETAIMNGDHSTQEMFHSLCIKNIPIERK